MGKSVEMLTNAIAEMRTYGEGFVIADQAPGLLDRSIIRNTNTKIIMRLPDRSDRELVGSAANLNEDQITELAKLPCGVAEVYQNEWIQPVLCKVDKYKAKSKSYSYDARAWSNNCKERNIGDCIYIAELLSKGTKMDKEILLTDIRPRLNELKIKSSVQVRILKMLSNPTKEPKMTKLAPAMSALFPDVYQAIEAIYSETKEVVEWTKATEQALGACIKQEMDARVRRHIIQAVITEYVLNKENDRDRLEEWSKRGGLK